MSLTFWKSWVFWVIIILVFLIGLWLISGKQKEPYIGATSLLNPLALPETNLRQIHHSTQSTQSNQMLSSEQEESEFDQLPDHGDHIISSERIQESSIVSQISQGNQSIKPILKKPQAMTFKRIKDKKAKSKGETECLRVMKELFGVEFYTVLPSFLINPETGCLLEIDVFNEDLTVEIEYMGSTIKYYIGVEYNGIQHVCWPNFTRQSLYDFIMQIRRDQYKLEECDKRNIYIITVPHNIPVNMIRDYIIWFLPNNAIARKKQRDQGHNVIEYPPNFPEPPQIKIDKVPDNILNETLARVRQRVIQLGWASADSLTPDSILPPRSPGIRYN